MAVCFGLSGFCDGLCYASVPRQGLGSFLMRTCDAQGSGEVRLASSSFMSLAEMLVCLMAPNTGRGWICGLDSAAVEYSRRVLSPYPNSPSL